MANVVLDAARCAPRSVSRARDNSNCRIALRLCNNDYFNDYGFFGKVVLKGEILNVCEKTHDRFQYGIHNIRLAVSLQETQTRFIYLAPRQHDAHSALSVLVAPARFHCLQAVLIQAQAFVLIAASPPRCHSTVRSPPDHGLRGRFDGPFICSSCFLGVAEGAEPLFINKDGVFPVGFLRANYVVDLMERPGRMYKLGSYKAAAFCGGVSSRPYTAKSITDNIYTA
ncbi:hypothetical protein EVAR_62048_1 [Eumeta japonica]|uniref:Uncharacterized protein n=1 Tax=Eumeta variegata TaxID=151549 RepID=A0A4C1YRW8_EUMVA|nr:hypothetical protein EVAR_62048_1 [Eumeta japonica]